jgi:hypothetical protein
MKRVEKGKNHMEPAGAAYIGQCKGLSLPGQQRLAACIDSSPLLAAQLTKLQGLFGPAMATPQPHAGTLQLFRENLVVSQELASAALPRGTMGEYTYINGLISTLVQKCNEFQTYERENLEMAIYHRSAQQEVAYGNALPLLVDIHTRAGKIFPLIKDDHAFDNLRGTVEAIRDCAHSDLTEYQPRAQQAHDKVLDAFNKAFKLGRYTNPYATYPQDYITPAAFNAANEAGILHLRMVKWWRSTGFPGYNAEIEININGNLWALAHLKWNVGKIPANKEDDPYLYNFKAPDNTSFPGNFSKIVDPSVQIYLLGACFPYVNRTSPPWLLNEFERYC